MTTYRTTIPMPEALAEDLETMRGVGKITELSDTGIVLELEADDEYELAETVAELHVALHSAAGPFWSTTVPRPRPVEDPS